MFTSFLRLGTISGLILGLGRPIIATMDASWPRSLRHAKARQVREDAARERWLAKATFRECRVCGRSYPVSKHQGPVCSTACYNQMTEDMTQ